MGDASVGEILATVREIRDLLRVVAEPAIAERDKKLRAELRKIVGGSAASAKAVSLMDGTRTQAVIHQQAKVNQGNLSTLVKRLSSSGLLSGGTKKPKLAISVPSNFFDDISNDG